MHYFSCTNARLTTWLDRQKLLRQWACSLLCAGLTQRLVFSIGPSSAAITDDCLRNVFRALIEEEEYGRAKKLVSLYGAGNASFLDELMQCLVASGELGSALEISQGDLSKCSDEMRALISLLGGACSYETEHTHEKAEGSAESNEEASMHENK